MTVQDKVIKLFKEKFGRQPTFVARAPGRVNLLGEHVDYNDGFVLPAAIDRATMVAFSFSGTDRTTLWAADFNAQVVFTPQSVPLKTTAGGSAMPSWGKYPAGVFFVLAQAGLATPGMDAVFSSDVPRGSGLSSSASVEMAFGVAWQALGGWRVTAMEMAKLGQKAENSYVGVNCGIMDQFASACGEKDKLLYLDCRSFEWQTIPLPGDVSIVIADTSVRRTLETSAYNERRASCDEAISIFKAKFPQVTSYRDITLDLFNQNVALLSEVTARRARHVVEEIARAEQAIPLLNGRKVAAFGKLMNDCHASLRDLYEVSCPELDVMAEIAQSLAGCYGARLTGAGFGGCTANLVERKEAGTFARELAEEYEARTGLHPEIYICQASQGAGLVE
jgi:galactokinase